MSSLVSDLMAMWQAPNPRNEMNGEYDHMNSVNEGYWGPIDASIDWCEKNYTVTYYIAEFFNTISSLPMVFWAMAGIYFTHYYASKEMRYKMCFMSLAIVGIGSVSFHATLRYYAQLLDELPMMLGMLCNFYCLIEINNNKNGNNKNQNGINYKLIVILTLVALFEIISYVYFQFYIIFLISYVGLAVVITFVTVRLINSKLSKTLCFACFLIYWGGIIVWNIDNYLCKHIEMLQLHALWHLCGGYASYLFILLCLVLRLEYSKKTPKLMLQHGVGHYVIVKIDK